MVITNLVNHTPLNLRLSRFQEVKFTQCNIDLLKKIINTKISLKTLKIQEIKWIKITEWWNQKKQVDAKEPEASRTFVLADKDPMHYFYQMYKNHVFTQTHTWGDCYRLFKYYRRFALWDKN